MEKQKLINEAFPQISLRTWHYIVLLVTPAKAGIHLRHGNGFRVKPGMTISMKKFGN